MKKKTKLDSELAKHLNQIRHLLNRVDHVLEGNYLALCAVVLLLQLRRLEDSQRGVFETAKEILAKIETTGLATFEHNGRSVNPTNFEDLQ